MLAYLINSTVPCKISNGGSLKKETFLKRIIQFKHIIKQLLMCFKIITPQQIIKEKIRQ